MATTLGWFLGGLILIGLTFIASGFFVGMFQWLVLQGRITHPWRWVIATIIGWTIGYLITLFGVFRPFEILDGVVIGLITGIAQWVILRRELYLAGWWIIFSVMAWTTGLIFFPGIMLTGTMSGAMTGLALEILLRYPRPKMIPDQT